MNNHTLTTCAFLLAAVASFVGDAGAASVTAAAGYSNAFGALPPTADWATFSRAGGAGDNYDSDTDVNANITSSGVTAQTTSSAIEPPAALATATWSSTGFYLQTRPTGNRYTALMGKFVNETGTNATEITLSYLHTIAAGPTSEDSGKGLRGYFSLTGLAGSWTNLAALNSGETNNGSSTVTTSLALKWDIGASFYLLWVDDNASAPQGLTDPANQIDNFSLQVTAGLPLITDLTCLVRSPTNNAVFVSGTPITTTAAVINGTAPHTVEYFTSSGAGNTSFAAAGSSTNPPFAVSLGDLPTGTYNIYAVVTDSAATAASTNSTTNTFLVADAINFVLTAPANDATFDNLTAVTGAATAAGGSAPYSVQFYLDDMASGAPVTSPPFERNFGALTVGDHAIRAAVTDARGWVSNSLVSSIHISGPLAVFLTPTNGTSYKYGASVTLAAAVAGGMAPYAVTFYTNNNASGFVGSPPFTADLGVLPVGSHTLYAEATDSTAPTAQEAISSTNIITILENPLVATLTSPTNGQTGTTPLLLVAAATVEAPLLVTNVEFFVDGASVGGDASAPYSRSVTGLSVGSHAVHAVARDSLGRTASTLTNQATLIVDPLANDNFANRFPLTGPAVTVTGNNTGATTEGGEPTGGGGNNRGATLWWTWTAPTTGTVRIDTFGSSFDTVLGAYTGSTVNGLTQVALNNNASGATAQSLVTFTAQQGTAYQIQVAGARIGGGGNFVIVTGAIQLNLQMPPSVTITSPSNGNVFPAGSNFTITATASSPNGAVAQVDFYRNSMLVGSVDAEPYVFEISNSPVGTNRLTAVVTDSAGLVATSAVVNVLVANIGITIISPVEGALFANTNPITVSAFALLPSGSITNVEFFVDRQPFGRDASAPFSATWSNVVAGSHRLTATALDNAGNSYNAIPVNIGVGLQLVPMNSIWKYLDNGSDQGTNWFAVEFNDSSWTNGPAELGYGDGDEATVLSFGTNENNKYITTYFRGSFVASNVAGLTGLAMILERDDGAVVYLNGQEFYRTPNMPAAPLPITSSTLALGQAVEDAIDGVLLSAATLVEGSNVLAVEIHQQAVDSSDISFNLNLIGLPAIIRNAAPTIALTSPTNSATFLAPPFIPLVADAADADGIVTNVEFFANGVKLADDATEPFGYDWINPPLGPHSVFAVATDDQGVSRTSAEIGIVVYDSAGSPFAQITSPPDGAAIEGGTNVVVTAYASALAGVTNVQFLANGSVIGEAAGTPYRAVWDAPFGTHALAAVAFDANGVRGTSAVVTLIVFSNSLPPTIARQVPLDGSTITNLTNITVTFSERVQHVDAGDLLVNGVPATGVTGSGSNYVFRFPQPLYGEVEIAWAASHGITDFGYPSDLPFDDLGAGARWSYELMDRTPPAVVARTPAAGALVTNLQQISVTFSESVSGVDAADLLVGGTPAFGVSGSDSNYTFSVSQPPSGIVNVTWATNHGIFDLAATPNPFNRTGPGAAWSFTLDARTVLVGSNSYWLFVKGTNEASTPTNAWRFAGYDTSGWSNAPAPFFYGDPYSNGVPAYTHLTDMQSNYSTIYLRQEFTVANRTAITNLLLNTQSDDGFIAWLNGVEVLRVNAPAGEVPYNAVAPAQGAEGNGQSGATYIVYTLTNNAASRLLSGTNVLAVHALNQSLASSDFAFNAQLYTFPTDVGLTAPRLTGADPIPGDLLAFTNLTVTFSEGVSGVDAADLLVNGIPASSVASTNDSTYTFGFAQPPYGNVVITWAVNDNIVDFDAPPKPFDGTAASSILRYFLINPGNPRIASQTPVAAATITNLLEIGVTFTEPVFGVDASDLLVNGVPATGLVGGGANYTFTITQPSYGTVAIRWATNHGIQDPEEPPNAFDPTRFGGQWNYTLVDPVPTVALTSPTNGMFVLAPATITLRASATDRDGVIERVEFFEGANRLGEDISAPYTLIWSNVLEGAYTLRAVATDNTGIIATSAPVNLTVVTSLPIVLVRGPYLQSGTPSSGLVRWRTDMFSDGLVSYGTNPANLNNFAIQTMATNEHIVQVSGLRPDTRYYYSIGSSAQTLVSGTNYWFVTSPEAGTKKPTRFWVLGDAGTAGNGSPVRQASVRDAFYNFSATNNRPLDLWLMLGDNAYDRGTDNEYQAAVFDMYPATLRNVFLWPALGNHETSQSTTATDFPYLDIFSLPQNGEAGGVPSGTKKYYSFDYANVHFVCLDSMTSGRTATSPMAQWLENDLATTAQEWVIVYFHHSLYTKGTHDSDSEGDLVELRQNIIPILEANGVDLVLMGHSHVYERSFLLDGHYGLSSTFTPSMKVDAGDGREDGTGAYRKNDFGRGVVYNIAGCSGQALGGPLNHPAHFVSLNELGSVVIDVASNRLDAIFLNSSGATRDHYTLLKRAPGLHPAAPLDLVAAAVPPNNIALFWTDASTNETGFIIESSTDGTNFVPRLAVPAGAISALDGDLLPGTTYYYRVQATNDAGASEFSNISSATTLPVSSPPAAPLNLVAAAVTSNNIALFWIDAANNEAGFVVERSIDGTNFAPRLTAPADAFSALDGDLFPGTTYHYRVQATNASGASDFSNIAFSTTPPVSSPPAAPLNLAVQSVGPSSIGLSWTDVATNELGYTIERSLDGITFAPRLTVGPDATSVLDDGLALGVTYYYRVRAYNSDGPSGFSNITSAQTTATPPPLPAAPSHLVATADDGVDFYRSRIYLGWRDRSTNESGFHIERSLDGIFFSPVATVSPNTTHYVDENLDSATPYYYRVYASNATGNSPPSPPAADSTHPQSDLVAAGATATFHAGIEGVPPIAYQWRFRGAAIFGATNESLVIDNARISDEGAYTVQITDAHVRVTSNPAYLFVVTPPAIVEHPQSRTNLVGTTATFSVLAVASDPLSYQWRHHGVAMEDEIGSTLTLIGVQSGQQDTYDVVVSTDFGSVTSRVAVLVVNAPPLAGADTIYRFRDESVIVEITALLANDSDADGDRIVLSGVSPLSARGATLEIAGRYVFYTPPAGLEGEDTFTYTVADGRGGSGLGVVTVAVTDNTPPFLAAMPDLVANVMNRLAVTNFVSDDDVPRNKLTLSLEAGAPTNARLHPKSGVFTWTPTRAQSPSTNVITLKVTDDGLPPFSDSRTFTVLVNDYVEVFAGRTVLLTGENGSIPLDFFSTAPLSGLSVALHFDETRLTDMAVEALAPQRASVSLHQSNANDVTLIFSAAPGQTLQGTQSLAKLHFKVAPGSVSAFVPLTIGAVTAARVGSGLPPGSLVNDGRVVVIGDQSLLEAQWNGSGGQELILYGRPGVRYTLEATTNAMDARSWTPWREVTLTNVFELVPTASPAPPVIFYRARE